MLTKYSEMASHEDERDREHETSRFHKFLLILNLAVLTLKTQKEGEVLKF
jgi:hypothetical protein